VLRGGHDTAGDGRAPVDAFEVDRDDGIEVGLGCVDDGRVADDPRDVRSHVDPTRGLDRRPREVVDRRALRDVGGGTTMALRRRLDAGGGLLRPSSDTSASTTLAGLRANTMAVWRPMPIAAGDDRGAAVE
jgi:hypothetical protein